MKKKTRDVLAHMLAATLTALVAFILPFIVSGAVTWIFHAYDKPLLFALALVGDACLFVAFLLVTGAVWLKLGD